MSQSQQDSVEQILDKYRDDLELTSRDYVNEEIPSDRANVEFEAAKEEAAAKLQQLMVEAERRGEIGQVRMLQHWQNLHDVSIEPADLQHVLSSLEQFPEQPLARITLAQLTQSATEEQ